MPEQEQPLTEKDLTELNARLDDLRRAEALIQQAIRGGIEMTDQQRQVRDLREQLLRLKQAFFPGR